MAFYEDKREHYGGALVLFKRNLAVAVPNAKTHRRANWYMRLKIGGRKGYVTRSTKLTIYEDAYEYAKSELLRLQQAAKLGHSLDEHTFIPAYPVHDCLMVKVSDVKEAASVFRQVVRDYCKQLSGLEVLVPLSVTVADGISKELLPTDKELKGIYLS